MTSIFFNNFLTNKNNKIIKQNKIRKNFNFFIVLVFLKKCLVEDSYL